MDFNTNITNQPQGPIERGILPTAEWCGKFVQAFDQVSACAHRNAIEKGFHAKDRSILEEIALIHEELGEATSGARHNNPPSDKIPFFTSVEEEYADAIIRIMDSSKKRGLRVSAALVSKMHYNVTRPHMHGKTA